MTFLGQRVTFLGLDVTSMGRLMEQKQELKKHVAAIHCANTLSLLQRKISNALLYHAYHELQLKAEHEITVKQLCTTIGYQGNNHSVIKESLRGLLTTLIEWNITDTKQEKESEDWTASTILASVWIKGPLCRYAYSPRMKELLYTPSMYGKINLIIQSKFQSSYGLALYENCIRYRELSHTKWFDLAVFRKLMGVPGDKYIIFRDFKRRVIDKSIEEVNKHSDLLVNVELKKNGRQVSKIRFKLEAKYKKTKIGCNIILKNHSCDLRNNESELLKKLLTVFSLQPSQAQAILKGYDSDYIQCRIDNIEQSETFRKGKINNVGGYLIQALKSDFKQPTSSKEIINRAQEQKLRKINTITNTPIQDDSKTEYNQYLKDEIDRTLKELSPDIYHLIQLAFRENLQKKNKFLFEKFQKDEYESEMIKASFRNFIRENFNEYLPTSLSFEEFQIQYCRNVLGK